MEEALFLVERGLLELLWEGVPMSVQECYAVMEAGSGVGGAGGGGVCGLDVYVVYGELKGQGWVVLRPSALYREKKVPPPPPPPALDSEEQQHQQQHADSATVNEVVLAEDEGQTEVAAHRPDEAATPQQLDPETQGEHVEEVAEWTELEWGCVDDNERARSAQLLQLPFLPPTANTTPLPQPPPPPPPLTTSSLLSLPLFLLWPPSSIATFRRSAPPPPSHLLLVSGGGAEEEGERLAGVLRTLEGVLGVWERAEREMRGGVEGKGERVVVVRDVPVVLATVHLTRVSYMQFGPLGCSPVRVTGSAVQ